MYLKRVSFYFFVLLLAAVLQFQCANAQVPGCRDPKANNYNPSATINEGSCTYDQTSYTPPVKVDSMNASLDETSGLQWAGGHLWTFNDGSGMATIYKIDTLSRAIFQTVHLEGASNIDWEDIAFDGTHLYVGDFGNNLDGARTDLKIYKFPISIIPDYTTNPVFTVPSTQIEVINFTYIDQVQPPIPGAPNNTRFDCEAMIVDSGNIHLFTKNWVDNNSTHYLINSIFPGTHVATPLETLPTGYVVTAADKAVGEEVVVLLGYQVSGTANHFMHLLSDYSGGIYFNGNKRRIDLPTAAIMGQAEGITFRNGTYGYISNENFVRTVSTITITVYQKLRSFNTESFVGQYTLPIDLKAFNVDNSNGVHRITWQFDHVVSEVQLQHSANGNAFKTISLHNNLSATTTDYKASSATNFYRVLWKNLDGQPQFSKTIMVRNQPASTISAHSLTTKGNFTFVVNSSSSQSLSFALYSAEGKQLALLPARHYLPGANVTSFKNIAALRGMACIVASSVEGTYSKMVLIQQ